MSETNQDPTPDLFTGEGGGSKGVPGAETAGSSEGAIAALEKYAGIDVSDWDDERRAALSSLPEGTEDYVKALLDKQHGHITGIADSKFKQAKEMLRQAEELKHAAAFGNQIAQNPEMLKGLVGGNATAQPQETVPLEQIDFNEPNAEDLLVARLGHRLGLENIKADVLKEAKTSITSMPEIKAMQLKAAVAKTWSELEASGVNVNRQQVADAYVNSSRSAGLDPYDVTPQELQRNLSRYAHVLANMNNGSPPAPSAPPANQATTPPSSTSAPTKGQKIWERENRPMTDDEVWEHAGDISPEEMEAALRQARGR